ncbi:hypothetical protein [Desulforamulus putei]|uniref:hypothetical protein n=1 Tax=Desulforamulus putei TaxID=74701 RepID=UPI002FDC9231
MKRILQIMVNRKVQTGKILLSATIILSLILAPMSMLEAASLKQNKTNILCIWTDRQHLKAVTLMNFDALNGRIGILSVPVFARLEANGKQTTIGLLWVQEGRNGLKRRLEEALQIQIDGHITFDQPVIEKASNLVGSIDVKGRETTLLQAFEDTRTERRKDDQDVIRAMAANIISPSGIKKVPRLLWLFTTQVDSDIHPELMLRIYKVVSHEGPTILTKKALQGKDYYQDGCRYRYVEPTTWKNIMNEISA